jgi:hypothetical protein
MCELFGCPCGPLGMPFGPGCTGGNIENYSNSESDDGSAIDGDVENSNNSDSNNSSQDENESDSDDSHGFKCKPKDCTTECAARMLATRVVTKVPLVREISSLMRKSMLTGTALPMQAQNLQRGLRLGI